MPNTYEYLDPVETNYNSANDFQMRGDVTAGDTGIGDLEITVSPTPSYTVGEIKVYNPNDTTLYEDLKFTNNVAGVLTILTANRGLNGTTPLSAITTDFKIIFPADTDYSRFKIDQAIKTIYTALSGYVKKTLDETIAGIKTFTSFPITPSSTPSTDYQVANKKYVDSVAMGAVGTATTTTGGTVKLLTAEADPVVINSAILTTRGDIIVRGSTVPERLAKGSQGSQLVMGSSDPLWIPQAVSTLTDGTTINIDLSLSSIFKVVLEGTNRIFTVTNLYPCTKELLVYQDATGSRTISDFKWRTETFTADEATDLLTVANVYKTGQRVQTSNAGGALPTGLSATTNYYVIYVSDTTIKLATSRANAIAGTAINITANGSGTNTLESYAHYADGVKFTLTTTGGALDKLFMQYTDNTFSISTGNFDEK